MLIDETIFSLKKPENGAYQYVESCFYSSRILSLKFLYNSIPFKYRLSPLGLPDAEKLKSLRRSELILKILDKLTFGSKPD